MSATPQGTVLALAEGRVGGSGLTGDIDIVLRRSTDCGETWQPEQRILDFGTDTLGNPCPVVDRDTGTLWLAFTRSPGKFTEKQIVSGESPEPTSVWISSSSDEGQTWSPPRDISADVRDPGWRWYGTGPGIGIQLRSGRLVFPGYHCGPDGIYRSHVLLSDDHGATWRKSRPIGENTSEGQLAERRDGTLVLNLRGTGSQGFRTVASSLDGGATWTEPFLEKQLPEAGCQAALLVLQESPAGQPIWLFSNPPGPTRKELTLRKSDDEGRTWTASRLVDPSPSEYSCLALLPDGKIGLLYERNAPKKSYRPEIRFAKFPLQWLDECD